LHQITDPPISTQVIAKSLIYCWHWQHKNIHFATR